MLRPQLKRDPLGISANGGNELLTHHRWVVLLSCGQLACVGVFLAPSADPYALNRYHFLQIRGAVRGFQRIHGRLPTDLSDVCPSMRGDENCPFWAVGQPLVDAWQRPFLYELVDDEFQITSTGPDQRAHTADDISFRPSVERSLVRTDAGCYRLNFAKWRELPGSLLVLDTTERSLGSYQVRPSIPTYMGESWYPASKEALEVEWVAMHHSAILQLRRKGDSLVGDLLPGGGLASPGIGSPPKPEKVTAIRTACGI